ncbi:MAG: chemotaxis protein CheW [Thermosynechococcaceae cyanobacterium]
MSSSIPQAVTPLKKALGEPYLQLQLTQHIPAVLPMEFAQEALVVGADTLTPIPNMPACVLGLLNRRSRVFWVVDLSQVLGLPAHTTNVQFYNIVLTKVGKRSLGLVVPDVRGVERFASAAIRSPIGAVPPAMVPFLRGCICLPAQKDILLVLDPEAIINGAISPSSLGTSSL